MTNYKAEFSRIVQNFKRNSKHFRPNQGTVTVRISPLNTEPLFISESFTALNIQNFPLKNREERIKAPALKELVQLYKQLLPLGAHSKKRLWSFSSRCICDLLHYGDQEVTTMLLTHIKKSPHDIMNLLNVIYRTPQPELDKAQAKTILAAVNPYIPVFLLEYNPIPEGLSRGINILESIAGS